MWKSRCGASPQGSSIGTDHLQEGAARTGGALFLCLSIRNAPKPRGGVPGEYFVANNVYKEQKLSNM